MELDGDSVNVDLREKGLEGEGAGGSLGTGGVALVKGETSDREATEKCEDLGISV